MSTEQAGPRLSLHQGEPLPNIKRHATVLLIGGSDHHRRTLATALCQASEAQDYNFLVRISAALPLPPTKDSAPRPRIDYIVFLADATSRTSYAHFQQMVHEVDPSYLGGHAALVLTQSDSTAEAVTREEVDDVADLGISVLHTALHSPRAVGIVRDQILQAVKVACGHTAGGITPNVLDSLNLELCNHTAISNDMDHNMSIDT
eukprot:m.19400 g.19400  ORF g.19400 m.19400 type:complete len:204 (+) comp3689_c0_seq2:105-716(+)